MGDWCSSSGRRNCCSSSSLLRPLPELGFELWQLDLDGKVGEKQLDDQMLLKEHQDGELLVS